jgi:hypothetical protein
MYEMKHRSPATILPRGNFDFFKYLEEASMVFTECPKVTTLVVQASLEEVTPIHCFVGTRQVNFSVPKQKVKTVASPDGYRFSVIHVLSEDGNQLWLVVSELFPYGFAVPYEVFADHEEEFV